MYTKIIWLRYLLKVLYVIFLDATMVSIPSIS